MIRFGKYKTISAQKQRQLRECFVDNGFQSLTQIARHVGVSRNTVKAHLNHLVGIGQISKGNRLIGRTREMRPAVNGRRIERNIAAERFLLGCAKRGVPVSVNLVQKKFGGDKQSAGELIKRVNAHLASRRKPILLRRSKSSQPKRSPTKK